MSDKIHVYEAIAAITDEMSKEGISKTGKNQQQGYAFRGIDQVLNALSPMLAKHKLNILPRCIERTSIERTTQKGGVLFYVTVKSDFDFVSAVDGSKHTVTTFGEAMDSADKATNKAMSAAYKYAAFQAFCIPTEGDNDADAHTHDVAPRPVAVKAPQDAKPMPDDEFEAARNNVGSAATMEELLDKFTSAYKAAKAYGDQPAMQGLTKIKDQRKKELEGV